MFRWTSTRNKRSNHKGQGRHLSTTERGILRYIIIIYIDTFMSMMNKIYLKCIITIITIIGPSDLPSWALITSKDDVLFTLAVHLEDHVTRQQLESINPPVHKLTRVQQTQVKVNCTPWMTVNCTWKHLICSLQKWRKLISWRISILPFYNIKPLRK